MAAPAEWPSAPTRWVSSPPLSTLDGLAFAATSAASVLVRSSMSVGVPPHVSVTAATSLRDRWSGEATTKPHDASWRRCWDE